MQNKFKIAALAVAISTSLFAGEAEEFYYDRGYENGYQKGLLKGQEIAFNEAKMMIKAYKDRIKAYEIGKYLVESKRLTAPQVYQEVKNGNMQIIVIPSRIEKEFSIDDIFAEFGAIPDNTKPSNETSLEKDFNELNSVYLRKVDGSYNDMFDKSSRDKDKTTLVVEKSSSNRDILNSANVAYIENRNAYEVVFFTKREKEDFCSQFKNLCK